MNSITNLLHKKNLVKKNSPNIETINSLSFNDIEKIGAELEDIIKSETKPVKNNIATHTASSGLGGGISECSGLSCRINSIDQLSRFALMYSDKIYIQSYFTKYPVISVFYDLDSLRETFFDDITLILELGPLIDNDFIGFYCPTTETCFTCQAKTFIGEAAGKNFISSYRNLQQQYLNNMSVEAVIEYDELEFLFDGPDPFFHHSYSRLQLDIPTPLKKRPTILKKIKAGTKVNLSKTMIKDLGFHTDYAHTIVSDALAGIAASKFYNSIFISDNNLHFNFLNSLQPVKEIANRNRIAEKYLTAIVPFITDVKLKDILKIRKREEESFLLFRKGLNEAIDNFSSPSGIITEKEAKSLYADIIKPSIAQLDIKVKQAKKDLVVNTYRPVIGIAGVISFGMLAGLFPNDLSEIIKALGLFKFGTEFVSNLLTLGDSEEKLKSEQFYFLWKLKKKANS